MPKTRGVYLLHFSAPIADHARHYMGWASDIDTRLTRHAAGQGARLLAVCRERGVTWSLARTWPGADRSTERQLKNRKNAPRLCPICRQALAEGRKPT